MGRFLAAATFTILLAAAAPPAAHAQEPPRDGPALTLLIFHPYPDSADPLGFPSESGRDYFSTKYSFLLGGNASFAFPYMVVDGLAPVAGLPDPTMPYMATKTAYEAAYASRTSIEAPATLRLSTSIADGQVSAYGSVEPVASLTGSSLHAWMALVQDHVWYQPPSGLTNGVFDHRFTVRDVVDLGPLNAAEGSASSVTHTFRAKPEWPQNQIYVAFWIQQDGHTARFKPYEVAQSTFHRAIDTNTTVQKSKGVLMEMLSATWCATCLYGDKVAEEMVQSYGLPELHAQPEAKAKYLIMPTDAPILVAVGLGAGSLVALMGRRKGAPPP